MLPGTSCSRKPKCQKIQGNRVKRLIRIGSAEEAVEERISPCFSAYSVGRQGKSVRSGGFWHPQTVMNEE